MLLEAKNIIKQYAGHLALDNVSIRIPSGSVYGLLGPNGAGKTSLIRIINQITARDGGELFFKGKRMQPQDVRHIGYLPEERGLYQKMKTGEQVFYLARLKGLSKTEARKKMAYWFDKFDIGSWRDKKVEELSKGMQQKVQFITTVLHEPEFLIFDEPFSGFDPLNANLLKQEILELKEKGATILLSTHNMASVEELCDRISLTSNSKVVQEGEVLAIREQYKQHLFVLKTRDNCINIPENDLFDIIATKDKKGITEIKIKLNRNISNNDLIQAILPYCSIFSFEEELPSMDEVFVKCVEKRDL